MSASNSFTAFDGARRIASGELAAVVTSVMAGNRDNLLVFDDRTGRPVDLDLRGSLAQALARLPQTMADAGASSGAAAAVRGPGRPRLGVTAREVTLLPRHWDWLREQPGGASVTLRRLVEAARGRDEGPAARRTARDATYRFITAMAGDAPGYEEAVRALYAGDGEAFSARTAAFSADVGAHARQMASAAF